MRDDSEEGAVGAGCRRFDAELAVYLEGENAPAVVEHARECGFCAAIVADMELMRSACQQIPLEDPPARLWANLRATLVAEGIIRESAGGRLSLIRRLAWGHVAAPAGALACLAFLSFFLLVPPDALDHTKTAGWLAVNDRTDIASQVYAVEDGELARQVQELQKSFEARESSLAPAVKATYRKGLESLDASIEECRASVEREPADTLVRQYLVAAYTQKAEVLATALQFDVR
jgi:hypothetical protein